MEFFLTMYFSIGLVLGIGALLMMYTDNGLDALQRQGVHREQLNDTAKIIATALIVVGWPWAIFRGLTRKDKV